MNQSDTLKALHAKYCALTGLDLRWNYDTESIWFLWAKAGNTEDDLEVTINFITRLYQKQARILTSCLRFHRLIGDTLFFDEMRAESRKVLRVKEENAARESVLRATGRTSDKPKDAVPVNEVLAREAFRQFVELKEKLK